MILVFICRGLLGSGGVEVGVPMRLRVNSPGGLPSDVVAPLPASQLFPANLLLFQARRQAGGWEEVARLFRTFTRGSIVEPLPQRSKKTAALWRGPAQEVASAVDDAPPEPLDIAVLLAPRLRRSLRRWSRHWELRRPPAPPVAFADDDPPRTPTKRAAPKPPVSSVRAGHSLSVFATQSKRRATERNSSARQRSRRGPAGVLFAVAVISSPP
jgi:hypothetical protein